MIKRSNHQGGWVTSFIVVGVLLLLALSGSIYFLKYRPSSHEQVAKNDSSETAKPTEVKKPEAKKERSEGKTPAGQTPVATPSTDDSSSSSRQQAESTPSSNEDSASALPTTGPADMLINILIIGLLGFATASYIRSRKLSLAAKV